MKTIPQVRKELLLLADAVRNDKVSRKLKSLVRNMYRRPYARKARTESITCTPELARQIKFFARSNPTWSYKRIANNFNVSIGRVSEAVAGKRQAA